MSLDTAISRFRRRQADLFRSTCTITRPFGEPVFDPGTGTYGQPVTTVYTGRCNVRPMRGSAQDVEAGAIEERVLQYIGKVPVDTPVLRNDTLTVTEAAYDAAFAGRMFNVKDVTADDWQVCRRLTLEEVAP